MIRALAVGVAGGPCEARNNGDAVVRYDQLADRWLITMPIFTRRASARSACPGAAGGDERFATRRWTTGDYEGVYQALRPKWGRERHNPPDKEDP